MSKNVRLRNVDYEEQRVIVHEPWGRRLRLLWLLLALAMASVLVSRLCLQIPGAVELSSLSLPWMLAQRLLADAPPPTEDEEVIPTWENLRGAEHCLRYATRQYTARLANVPSDETAIRTCRETPAEIHGISMLPTFCRDLVGHLPHHATASTRFDEWKRW